MSGRPTILLADDHVLLLEAFRRMLEPAFDVVGAAADGAALVEEALRLAPDVVVADVSMPRMNGLEAAQAIRADALNRDTPILATTANAFDEDRQACLAAGMDDHIAKPLDPDRFYETVLAWLGRRPQPAHP